MNEWMNESIELNQDFMYAAEMLEIRYNWNWVFETSATFWVIQNRNSFRHNIRHSQSDVDANIACDKIVYIIAHNFKRNADSILFHMVYGGGNECTTSSRVPLPTSGYKLHRISRRFWRDSTIPGENYLSNFYLFAKITFCVY